MSDFVRICSSSQIPAEGDVAEFTVQGGALCVAHINGVISVIDGVCPHEGGPLGEGIVEDGRVVCPWHGYAFDVRSGACVNDPELKAEIFEAKVEGGELQAKL
jgi:nitrite reductase (NADH) small subunit